MREELIVQQLRKCAVVKHYATIISILHGHRAVILWIIIREPFSGEESFGEPSFETGQMVWRSCLEFIEEPRVLKRRRE